MLINNHSLLIESELLLCFFKSIKYVIKLNINMKTDVMFQKNKHVINKLTKQGN